MKRVLKWIGALLGVVVLVVAVFAVNAVWFKPFHIRVFYERVFLEYALEDPEMLSSIRILEPLGIDYYNDDLTDASVERTRKMNRKTRQDLETLRRYDREDLDSDQRLSYDILEWFLDMQVTGQEWAFHDYPVNQMFGVQSSLPDFMVQQHQVADEGDAHDYVARLTQFDTKFGQVLEQLRHREEKGIIPPRFVVEKVLKEMRNFVDTEPREHLLYAKFEEKLDEAGIEGDTRATLLDDAEAAIAGDVFPAYRDMIAYFEELQPVADTNHGVWKLPDGENYYDHQVRWHTTTDLTAEEVHRIGLEEVARIGAEMDIILTAEGYTEGTVGERVNTLATAERFLYPDTEEGRERILDDYQAIIDDISEGLDPYFGVRPDAGVEVKRIPEFKEETAPKAYYQMPAMDGSRPGRFFANLRDVEEVPKWGMRTLAYHEAVPGHHFQKALQQEISGVPTFRNLLGFTAFAEGWALYAERLAWELGFLENPYDDLGRLQAEMFRAVRLVVDTGIHYKRWSRERAIRYMMDHTGMPESEVISEIERYFVMPGQALAYKIGMLKFLQLREQARDELGEAFDVRAFHDLLLTGGDMPLEIAEQRVERWISEQKADI